MSPADNSSVPQLFSGGNEKAGLILSTGVLQKGWRCLTRLQNHHRQFFVDTDDPKFTIVALGSSADHTMDEAQDGLPPPIEELDKDSSPLGSILITKDNPKIRIHRPALSAFRDLLGNHELTAQLKELQKKPRDENPDDQKEKQLILVGRSLGGSVAALFALWLLKNQNGTDEKIVTPFCITYGSPFIGDAGLQKAVGKFGKLKARFWHVVRDGDVVPHAFVVPKLASQVVPGASEACDLKPFGTYLFCAESGCTCIDHPDSVLDLLQISKSRPRVTDDYGAVLQQLKEKVKRRSNATAQDNPTLEIGLSLQLQALKIDATDQLLKEMETRETILDIRRKGQNPSKKLNDAKKYMALLEWYRKRCAERGMDYYDCFKARSTEKDYDVINFMNFLNRYWKETVEEAENNPEAGDIPLRDTRLFAGTVYRRMVEPLEIANYYRNTKNRDYVRNKPRPHHYVMLEKWHGEQKEEAEHKEKKDDFLTEDSCFWARVEDAMLDLKTLRHRRDEGDAALQDHRKKVKEFVDYVSRLKSKDALSKTVFLEESTFMRWWRLYRTEPEQYHHPDLFSDIFTG